MPLFAYVCAGCGETSEILVRGEAQPVCPKCGSKKLEKQMSHFAPMSAAAPAHAPSPGCGGCSSAGACPMRG